MASCVVVLIHVEQRLYVNYKKRSNLVVGFPNNPAKMEKAQRIRSRLEMQNVFPIYRYWNRDDIATGNFDKKVTFMLDNNGDTPPYLRHRAHTSGAVFAAAGP